MDTNNGAVVQWLTCHAVNVKNEGSIPSGSASGRLLKWLRGQFAKLLGRKVHRFEPYIFRQYGFVTYMVKWQTENL